MRQEMHGERSLLQFLGTAEPFRELERPALERLLERLTQLELAPHETLFELGDPADALYMVVRGTLIQRGGARQGSQLDAGEGRCVGVMAGVREGRRLGAAQAGADGAKLLRLSRDDLLDLGERDPALLRAVERQLHRDAGDPRSVTARFFGVTDPDFLEALGEQWQIRDLHAGEQLFAEGDAADGLYFVVAGRVTASIARPDGKPQVVGDRGPGSPIGEMALFTGRPRGASIHARRDSRLLFLPRERFVELVQKHPEAVLPLMRTVIDRLQQSDAGPPPPIGSNCVAVLPLDPESSRHELTDRLAQQLEAFGSVLVLDRARFDGIHGRGAAESALGDPRWSHLGDWFHRCEREHDYVLYDAGPRYDAWWARCVRQSDRRLLLTSPTGPTDALRAAVMKQASSGAPTAGSTTLLFLHPDGRRRPDTAALLDRFGADHHHHVRPDRPEDLARVTRALAGRSIGVVLGGGGASGLAHVGVLRALQQAKIPIDAIGGTSMGAVLAAFWAVEPSADALVEACRACLRAAPHRAVALPPIGSLLRGSTLSAVLKAQCGDARIEDLWIDYFCVSTNLTRSRPKIHRRGLLWRAIRASCSLPGIFPPAVEDGELFVDGGLFNNVPVDVMRRLSSGRVIASDVTSTDALRVDEALDAYPSSLRLLGQRLDPRQRHSPLPSLTTVLTRSVIATSVHHRDGVAAQADLYLAPEIRGVGLLQGDALDALIELGYRYASEILVRDAWRERLLS